MKLLSKSHGSPSCPDGAGGGGGESASVSFMDITSACKAHSVEHSLEDRVLRTDFYDPTSGGHGGGGSANGPESVSATGAGGSDQTAAAAIQSRLHG